MFLEKFKESKNIIDWLSYFSAYVWEELKFAFEEDKSISKVDEREFTNEMVRQIAKLIKLDKIPLPIRLFHSPNEGVNGSDLEIILQLNENENIIFPCQAKRLYVENSKGDNIKARYERYDYKTQADDLISYSRKICGFPLFMFYNFTHYEIITNYNYPNKELYGCTIGSAIYLKQNVFEKPTFPNFHPPAVPLVSIAKFKNILSLNTLWGKTTSHNARILSDKEIFGDNRWEEIGPPIYHKTRFVPYIDLNFVLDNNRLINEIDVPYNPKYRIIIMKNVIDLNCRKNNFIL